ncbi:BLOC-1-related complex subunit 6-like isoform X2 [Carassius auratus]|nr:BLOC-1-related complex subunit 6-like isoform X2 [Carassius auratus]XP_026115371.1 BLOC-1-related complex subunit 6-like isoform X2 [Carassius auratus]XP_026115372.1 BLOC-1-related complex subunit 6-like isoform X2 [Carassius auratus]XP_026115373.1 BLOC-1-related complex subunit 6-like isoform X2 [Carassius auratus]
MSRSAVTGQDAQEANNGVDTSDCPKASDWSEPHGFTTQGLKFRDGADFEAHDGSPPLSETLKHTLHHMDSCRDAHTDRSESTPTESLVQHNQCAHILTEDSSLKDTHSCENERIHSHYKKELEEWRGEEDEKKASDGEVNNINKREIKQKKETLISVQPVGLLSAEHPSTRSEPEEWADIDSLDEVQPNASISPDEAPPLVPAPPPNQATPPLLPDLADSPCPAHVMAEVRVRSVPERDRVVRGMQDSKSLDEISGACGGGGRGGGARGGQVEGRRATISSALELEGTVSHDGDLTHFIAKNLEDKIKMSSRLSLDTDSDCSGPVVRGLGSLRRPADIPPIDPSVLLDLHKHTQDVAQSVELMLRSLNGTIQNMTALSVGYIQTYRDSVDSLGESVDMSIKGMYTLMARCEELDRSMQPIHALAAQIRDIKRTLDALETICK